MLSVSKNGVKTREFVYNKINNLMSSTVDGVTTTYAYNGDRLRETKTTNGITTRHIYDGTDIVADVSSGETTNYVRGVGLIYSENMATGEKRGYDLNAHEDVVKRKNADGTAENFNYRAYGKAAAATPEPFGYCGEYTDSETGFVYLRNRYYDPDMGRFINVDPIYSGANWYAYCNGNPVKYIDPSGMIYLIAWSYGKSDLEPYKDSQGNVNWEKFTVENSFARAAATRRQELIDMGIPASEIDVQRIDNENDMKNTWKMWSGYDTVEGMNIYSGGISVAGGGGEFLSDATKLKWGSVFRRLTVNGSTSAMATVPYAVFHGCNTANGDFAQDFATTQGVTTYAQVGYASFSRNSTWHIPINDGATSGSVYLYHFNWKNIKNTDGLGKVFYPKQVIVK